jgi:hypothetical protein
MAKATTQDGPMKPSWSTTILWRWNGYILLSQLLAAVGGYCVGGTSDAIAAACTIAAVIALFNMGVAVFTPDGPVVIYGQVLRGKKIWGRYINAIIIGNLAFSALFGAATLWTAATPIVALVFGALALTSAAYTAFKVREESRIGKEQPFYYFLATALPVGLGTFLGYLVVQSEPKQKHYRQNVW